ATNTCPKIIETFGSTEFWDLRMGPGIYGTGTTPGAAAHAHVQCDFATHHPAGLCRDIPLPDDVRRYYFPGTTHGGGNGAFAITTSATGGAAGSCQFQSNPNNEQDYQRALFVALKDWVISGTEPPGSVYPNVSDGTLVPSTKGAMGFPTVPSIPFKDGFENTMLDYAWGPNFIFNDMSGVIAG